MLFPSPAGIRARTANGVAHLFIDLICTAPSRDHPPAMSVSLHL